MARKARKEKDETTQVNIEEVVTPLIETEEVKVDEEPVAITEAKPEPIKKHLIANAPTAARRLPLLNPKYIMGHLAIGTAYGIQKEVHNVTGAYYLLNNGLYVTQSGHYTIY